jgi:hypothetical protein
MKATAASGLAAASTITRSGGCGAARGRPACRRRRRRRSR